MLTLIAPSFKRVAPPSFFMVCRSKRGQAQLQGRGGGSKCPHHAGWRSGMEAVPDFVLAMLSFSYSLLFVHQLLCLCINFCVCASNFAFVHQFLRIEMKEGNFPGLNWKSCFREMQKISLNSCWTDSRQRVPDFFVLAEGYADMHACSQFHLHCFLCITTCALE